MLLFCDIDSKESWPRGPGFLTLIETAVCMLEKTSIQKYIRRLKPIPTSLTPAGELTHDIQCVLFDIYGTLFISESGDISLAEQNSPQLQKIEALLVKYSIKKPARILLNEFYLAIKNRHAQLHANHIDFPEVKIDQIWQPLLQFDNPKTVRRFAAEFELIANPVYPMPNLAKMLASVRQQGHLMGIISNAQFFTPYLFKWFLGSYPEALGFKRDLIFYSYNFEIAKPSAKLFQMAAATLKAKEINPPAVLYLGNDMLNDIYPAHMAGFQTALFAGDQRSLRLRENDPRCRNLTPDLVVTDLGQLIHHLI